VAAGSHFITLVGLAANCRVAAQDGGPTRQVVMLEGQAAEVSFTVTCVSGEPSQIAFVRGGRIYRANADGTGIVQLTSGPNDDDPTWSPDGRRIAFIRQSDRRNEWGNAEPHVYVMDADGTNVELLTSAGRFMRHPAWSPDGRKIAVAHGCNDGTGCIMIVPAQADGTVPARVGFKGGTANSPAWSPDGAKIAFTSDARHFEDEAYDLYVTDADSSSVPVLLRASDVNYPYYFQPAWSPDGGRIALVMARSAIAIVNTDGSGLTILAEVRGFAKPTWSPDGRTIAFASTTCHIACSTDIYVVGADGKDLRLLIADGQSPAWRR
jgi:TolB protein